MPTMTPEELAQYYSRQYPGPVPGDLQLAPQSEPGGLAPAAVQPTVSTGGAPAPPALAQQQGVTARLEQMLAESRGQELALAAAGPGGPSAMSLAIAGAGDVASRLQAARYGGPTTNTLGGLQQQRQDAQQAHGAALQRQRDFQAKVLNDIGASQSRDLDVRQKAYAVVGDTLKSGLADPAAAERAINEASGMLAQGGQDANAFGQLMRALVKNGQGQVAVLLGRYAGAFDTKNEDDQKELKLLESTVFASVVSGHPAEAVQRIQSLVAAKAGREVTKSMMETARNLRGRPEFKGGIPIEVLYDKFIGKYGQAGAQAYIDFLNGQLTVGEGGQRQYQNLQSAMVAAGFKGFETEVAAQKAGATTRATEQAKVDVATEPGNVRRTAEAKATEEAITRPGALARAEGLKQVEEKYARPASIAERLAALKQKADQGDQAAKLEYDTTLQVEKELREASATKVTLPQQLPADVPTKLADLQGFASRLRQMAALHRSNYTGPIDQYLGWLRERTGLAGDQETIFRQIKAGLRNELTALRSGAAVTPSEYERIQDELPTDRDPAGVFVRKAESAARQIDAAVTRRLRAYEAFGFKVGALAPEGPAASGAPAPPAPAAPAAPTTPRAAEEAFREKHGLPKKP